MARWLGAQRRGQQDGEGEKKEPAQALGHADNLLEGLLNRPLQGTWRCDCMAAMNRTALVVAFTLCASSLLAQDTIDPGRLAGMKARSIGPAAMSGRVAAVAGVESDPDVLYTGAANGGVWKSVNGGLTWAPLFDDQKVASIGAIA